MIQFTPIGLKVFNAFQKKGYNEKKIPSLIVYWTTFDSYIF